MKKTLFTLAFSMFILTLFAQKNDVVYPEGLKVGDMAPNFKAIDNAGKPFSLKKELKKGEVVIVFYRGQWCPFCNKELSHLNDSLSLITAKGATVVAISPETIENVTKTVNKTKATFPVIGDKDLSILKAYKVNYAVEGKMLETYKKYKIDFTVVNGSNGNTLPVPSTYVIGKDRTVKYVFFNPDYKLRASVQDILNHL
ncbi:peroxiredoxin family protein [Parasediminibacterium sp. JCM 36343]|uniref:peroxiredoxin family protein n=1 Tax=Parasediminibacterium sp. JCM 36343 TaxID=3374279 RepID=UPI003978B0C0